MTIFSTPGLDTLLSGALSDQTLSYQELLSLLQAVAPQGVTEAELLDLRAVYNDQVNLFGNEVNRDYLKSIYYNVVFGNPGNKTWWGGEYPEPLGNLQNGSTEQSLLRLIDKWFLGLDLPLPSSNEGQSTQVNSSVRYQTAEGDLFVGGVSEDDIVQGQALTCYLLSALGSIAKAQSQFITSSFINNGNGTYGVRLYIEGRPIYTTVDLSLPVQKNGKLVFASDDQNRTLDGELWISLLEKAYAQFNEQVDTREFSGQEVSLVRLRDAIDPSKPLLTWNQENSYTAIGRSFAQGIKQFTNLNYQYYSSYLTDSGFSDGNDAGVNYSADPATYKQTLIDALNAGAVGWLASYGSTTSSSNFKFNLVPGHAFMLLGYDSATDKFIIRNPWGGAAQVTPYNPEFEAPIEASGIKMSRRWLPYPMPI